MLPFIRIGEFGNRSSGSEIMDLPEKYGNWGYLLNSESLKSHAEFMDYDYTYEDLNGALFIQYLRVLLMCHDNCALIRQVFNPKKYSMKIVGCIGEDGKERKYLKRSLEQETDSE